MPDHSEASLAQIQQLYNRVNDYLRKNMVAIRAVAAAATAAQTETERNRQRENLRALKTTRLDLLGQHARVFELEQAYEASHRMSGEAEARLAEGVKSANKLVNTINGLADILNKVSEFAGIITRLIGVFS